MAYKLSIPSTRLYQYLSPREYLLLMQTDRGSVKKSKFIPPELGTLSLGKFYVEYYYEPKSYTRATKNW
jgi:hypothetical protein